MMHFPTILAIIPARKGSKGVPGKNMKLLSNKPLIQYTIESALESKLLTKIVVSSDCEATIAFAKNWERIEAPFVRPPELSDDVATSLDVIKHAVTFYQNSNNHFDCICLLQPSSPFRSPGLIDNAVIHMLKSNADSLITIRKIPDQYNPHWAFGMAHNELHRIFSKTQIATRRQDLPDSFSRDGKIYLSKTAWLSQGLMAGKCVGYRTDDEPNVNIDTMDDWQMATRLIQESNG